jgi:hypothetical protein
MMKSFDFNGHTNYLFYGKAVIEIPTFRKGEFRCQTLQIVEKELKGQAV